MSRVWYGLPWPIAALWGVSLVLLGILIAVDPRLMALAIAAVLVAAGALVTVSACIAGWDAWKRRPRRIRVRFSG